MNGPTGHFVITYKKSAVALPFLSKIHKDFYLSSAVTPHSNAVAVKPFSSHHADIVTLIMLARLKTPIGYYSSQRLYKAVGFDRAPKSISCPAVAGGFTQRYAKLTSSWEIAFSPWVVWPVGQADPFLGECPGVALCF